MKKKKKKGAMLEEKQKRGIKESRKQECEIGRRKKRGYDER